MKNKLLAGLFCLLTIFTLITGSVPVTAESKANTVGEVQTLADGIVDFKLKQSGAGSIQSWIDGELSKNAGLASEWYILSLSQNGSYDFSSYQKVLKNYLANNEVYSASSKQKYALALISVGSSDAYINEALENSIGQQGVMSWIYGLHLLNNGYTSSAFSADTVKQTLISLQLSDGGWAISGANSDVDVTAMAVQALAPHYNSDSSVHAAIDRALSLLSLRQLNEGDYSSYGVANPESTAQVITALAALGINCENDGRFIKDGRTLIDGLQKYRLPDGSFCHKINGGFNENATGQSFYSLVAYIRMSQGKSSLYILDKRNPQALPKAESPTAAPAEPDTQSVTVSVNNSDTNISVETAAMINETVASAGTETTDKAGAVLWDEDLETASEAVIDYKESEDYSNENAELYDKADRDNSETEAAVTKNAEDEANINVTASADKERGFSYKLWVSLGIVVAAAIAGIILFICKKRNKKNFIFIAAAALLAILFVLLTDFKSADNYYNGDSIVKENAVGTVTLTIRCDTVIGKLDSKYIPEDGIILEAAEFAIARDDTVYDILTEAAQGYSIHMENDGANGMVYISGINYLYEFDFGELSGWMYFVNGEEAGVGCDEYVLSDGDAIEWLYTCELGNDLR